jgi:Spy/CpxP family protein refolding chaperone
MRKGFAVFAILSFLILFSTSVFAEPQRGMMRGDVRMMRSPARILHLLQAKQKELNITDSQLEKIKSLIFLFEEKMIEMRSKTGLQHLELRKLMLDKENLDYEKIKEVLSKASNSREEMFIERLKLRREIDNILTPEQREALKKMREESFRGRSLWPRGDRFQRFPGFTGFRGWEKK